MRLDATESETNVLPQPTDAAMSRVTAPTTVLTPPPTVTTGALAKPKRRRTAIAVVVIVTAIAAAASAILVDSYLSRKRAKSIESIAVMPFANESGNQDLEYLSDGMTESLITSLSQLPNHQVVARAQASFPSRNKKGFASSSEVPDQNNVAGLRTTSKHKIGSICGKSKSKDEIRFEVG